METETILVRLSSKHNSRMESVREPAFSAVAWAIAQTVPDSVQLSVLLAVSFLSFFPVPAEDLCRAIVRRCLHEHFRLDFRASFADSDFP